LERRLPVSSAHPEEGVEGRRSEQIVRIGNNILFRVHKGCGPKGSFFSCKKAIGMFQEVIIKPGVSQITGKKREVGTHRIQSDEPHACH
jgi:hypothetical protein